MEASEILKLEAEHESFGGSLCVDLDVRTGFSVELSRHS